MLLFLPPVGKAFFFFQKLREWEMGRIFGPAMHLIQSFMGVPLLRAHLSSGSQGPCQSLVLVETGREAPGRSCS